MAFELSKCSKLRLLSLAVAYGQISRNEYIKLRRLQLQAIEFHRPTPAIEPELIERLSVALSQTTDQTDYAYGSVGSPQPTNQLEDTINKHQSDKNIDYGQWDDSYRSNMKNEQKIKESNNKMKSITLLLVGAVLLVGLGWFGFDWYATKRHQQIYHEPVQALTSYQQQIERSDSEEKVLALVIMAIEEVSQDPQLFHDNTIPLLLEIIQQLDLQTQIQFGLTTHFVELQILVDAKKKALARDPEASEQTLEQLKLFSKTLLEIKLRTFSGQ